MKKLMIIWCMFCIAVSQRPERDYAWDEIDSGDVMAWGRHITGQDTDTHTTWHEFKSIAVIHGRSDKANGDTREDDELWAVVERSGGTNIECFQALDWGEDADYCWFVDAGVDEWGYTAEVPEVPEVPALPPAEIRPEMYAIAGRQFVAWFNSSYEEIRREDVGGGSELCSTIDHDTNTGAVAIGTGLTTEGCKIVYWDIDGNKDIDKFHPTDNWGVGTSLWSVCTAVRFSTNGDYLYAAGYSINLNYHMYKFDVSTGLDVWTYTDAIMWPYSMYVDASDNVYMCFTDGGDQGVQIIDSDGNLTAFHQMYVKLVYGLWVDEVNSRIYLVGSSQASAKATISGINIDGTNLKRYNTFDVAGDKLVNVTTVDGEVFAVGTRTTKGLAGATATVWKFDSDLNVLASYDTGASTTAEGIVENEDGNLVIRVTQESTAVDQIILDTDLNLVTSFTMSPFLTDLYFGETIIIDYMDDGTPAVPAVPAVPGYWTPGLDHIDGDVCVYADGIPLGVYSVDSEGGIVGLDETDYDVLIAGINYYSIYESFPLIPRGYYSSIKELKIDFYESMGCHVGVTLDDSVDWTFSYDDFATSIEPVTEIKEAPFVWGTSREPTVYLHEWDPVPMALRGVYPLLNLSAE